MSVPLPTSDKSPYATSYWSKVEDALVELKKNPSYELLEKTILSFLNQSNTNQLPDYTDLKTLNRVFSTKSNEVICDFVSVLCEVALDMPRLFPSKDLKIHRASSCDTTTFSRRQVACLVAHMFFCTFLPWTTMRKVFTGHFVGELAPTGPITFRLWHTSRSGPTVLYLTSLLNYFTDYAKCSPDVLDSQQIVFEKKTLNKHEYVTWGKAATKLVKVTSHLDGRIGDSEGHVEMDFANQYVGFGTTGTQEELLLGVSPETCPVVLFSETLSDKDAVLMSGMKKYGSYKGYGFSAHYTGVPEDNWDWGKRKILAMDALCYIGDEAEQLKDEHLKRELNKAFCAFLMVPGGVIDTGHWGCGAFGGNKGVKALIQIMAGSEAGVKELQFFCFGDKLFHTHFIRCLDLFDAKGLTVMELWSYLKEYEKKLCGLPQTEHVGVLVWLQKVLK